MKLKFLLKNWSSVSTAAAVLLGVSSRASASKPLISPEGPKVGDGNPYEPLILKPPILKMIAEERFAGHTSHASHASHASHYSGSGTTQPPPLYSPVPPAQRPPAPSDSPMPQSAASPRSSPSTTANGTLIELANGTIIHGTLLVKSAAGITVRALDGTSYKFERKQLSERTISDLNLPPENSPATTNQTSPKTDTTPKTPQKTEELERTIADLRAENAALRAQAPASQSPNKVTYRVAGLPKNTPFLNVREGPGSNFPVVGSLPPNAGGITFGPKRVTNGWTVWQEVTGGGYNGWVNAQYLVPEPSTR